MIRTSAAHPYAKLPARAYWRSAVSEKSPLMFEDIFAPRFAITPDMAISAAGSCFAQHISKQFKQRGYTVVDVEPAPAALEPAHWMDYGYGLYSARFGNVYSMRQLLQLFQRAMGQFVPADHLWESDCRFYDPFRPSIEPGGFATKEEAERDIAYHLSCVAKMLKQTDLFVFTFGLTEAWINAADGAVYPTCPGTIVGSYDAALHKFYNFTYGEVMADTEAFIALARSVNPKIKFLFTVSPVPLTATASGHHVLPASVYSKSVLRAVCGELLEKHSDIDYFPSYELVSSHPFRAMFFDPNLRTVAARGVEHVMDVFFSAHAPVAGESETDGAEVAPLSRRERVRRKWTEDERVGRDTVCDEEILEVFG